MADRTFDKFNFNRVERVGVISLTVIVLIIILIRLSFGFLQIENYDYSRLSHFLDSISTSQKDETYARTYDDFEKKGNQSAKSTSLQPFSFDPNLVSYDAWIKMGLSPKKAKVIENYKAKGGRFLEANDLKKIYCITKDEYLQLEPFIFITQHGEKNKIKFEKKRELVLIDLNRIDETGIQIVNGVGPSYAKRIMKYRQLLGGFVEVNQLLEVYGLDSTMFEKIAENFYVTTDSITKIDINTSDYKTLLKHPYMNKKLAYGISHFKSLHGKFKSPADLKRIEGMNDSIFNKINPYLGGYN